MCDDISPHWSPVIEGSTLTPLHNMTSDHWNNIRLMLQTHGLLRYTERKESSDQLPKKSTHNAVNGTKVQPS